MARRVCRLSPGALTLGMGPPRDPLSNEKKCCCIFSEPKAESFSQSGCGRWGGSWARPFLKSMKELKNEMVRETTRVRREEGNLMSQGLCLALDRHREGINGVLKGDGEKESSTKQFRGRA